jgi:hypothetical protein
MDAILSVFQRLSIGSLKDVKIASLWVKQKKVYFGLVKDKCIYGALKDEVKMVEINPSEDIPKDYICETTGLLIAKW